MPNFLEEIKVLTYGRSLRLPADAVKRKGV
jgi:hypothetical protein